jgi:hypothetical protein
MVNRCHRKGSSDASGTARRAHVQPLHLRGDLVDRANGDAAGQGLCEAREDQSAQRGSVAPRHVSQFFLEPLKTEIDA